MDAIRAKRLAGVIAVWLIGCNNPPAEDLQQTLSVQVKQNQDEREPVRLDFLWIVDNSASMCQEQNQLAQSFEQFADIMQKYLKADVRAAVTVTDVLTATSKGKFNRQFATDFPMPCAERVVAECQYDFQCQDDPLNLGDRWLCESATGGYSNVLNLNGSINSTCRFQCDTNQDCIDGLLPDDAPNEEAAQWKCLTRGAQPSEYGCVKNPATSDCPADLPPVLKYSPTLNESQIQALIEPPADGASSATVDDLSASYGSCASYVYACGKCDLTQDAAELAACKADLQCDKYKGQTCSAIDAEDKVGRGLCAQECVFEDFKRKFRCIATVGAVQSTDANLEAGMKAAWLALDPNGENAQQLCLPKPDPDNETDLESKVAAEELLRQCFQCKEPNDFGVPVNMCVGGYSDTCDTLNPACRRFLREDSYLIMVFLGDEDDCSVDEGKKILAEDYPICAVMGDSDQDLTSVSRDIRLKSTGWNYGAEYRAPLAPVSKYFNRFKTLLPDPARVLVAAIGGDAYECFTHEEQASQKFADKFSTEYWCYQYQPNDLDTCLPEFDCYKSNLDPTMAELAAQCIADSDESQALSCYQDAIPPELQPEVDECIQSYRSDPEVNRIFSDSPEFAESMRNEICNSNQQLDDEQISVYRERYRFAKLDPKNPLSVSAYICTSALGKADYSGRFLQLVNSFGPNGFFQNICSREGIGPALESIAQDIIPRILKVCLPQPVEDKEQVRVIKVAPADETGLERKSPLQLGVDYTIEPALECSTNVAVFFNGIEKLPDPKDRLEIYYQVDQNVLGGGPSGNRP